MGTPDFPVPTLKTLVEAGHQVIAVVTQPDKPKDRGKEVQMIPVKMQTMEYGIPIYQPTKTREASFVEILKGLEADVYVVIVFGQILPEAVLELPKCGCINAHASLLPKYRGAAPIQWCVIDGERETGITTMMMSMGLDAGDMLEKAITPIEEKGTGGSLHDKLSMAGGDLISSTLEKPEEGTLVRMPQTDEGTCYVKMLIESLRGIDWNQGIVSIECLIRDLSPRPSAYTMWNGKTIKIWAADMIAGRGAVEFLSESGVPAETKIAPGAVTCSGKRELVVYTDGGLLSIRELRVEGKKCVDIPAFFHGYPIPAGDMFVKKESD